MEERKVSQACASARPLPRPQDDNGMIGDWKNVDQSIEEQARSYGEMDA